MRFILFILILFNISLFAQNNINTSFSYIKLENKPHTLNEIVEKSEKNLFSTLQKNHSKFGFTDNIFWIKTITRNNSSTKSFQVMELNHPSLDYIDIYELKNKELILKKKLGDLRLYDKSTFMPNPNYEFSISAGERKVFFIKIVSEGSLNIGISVQDTNTYNLSSSKQIKWLSFYFGAIVIMLMYNFIIYLIIKNRSFLYYVLFHVSYIIFALSLSGISFELFWPHSPWLNQYVIPMSMALIGVFGILFAIHFMDIKNMSIKLYKFLYLLAFMSFLIFLLPLLTAYNFTIQLSSFISFFIAVVLFTTSIYLLIFKKNKNALFYVIAWGFFFLGVAIAHLSNIGFIPSTLITNFSSQIGSFFEALLLSIGLAYYYNGLKSEHSELTYTNKILRELSQTDVLTGIYNRRYFYNEAHTLLSIAKEKNSECYLLMIDLDYFKGINDTYGHDIGDKVLKSFANICQTTLRENDIFARFGGEEFVLFLSGTDKSTAIEIAQSINTAIRHASFDFAPDLKLTVSIGLSNNTRELSTLLEEADQALYQAKESGRDTYKVFA